MKKSEAITEFNRLYDATYDEALAFVSGKTGNIALADDILTDTYSALYSYLRKIKNFDLQEVQQLLLNYLKSSTNRHQFGDNYVVQDISNKNSDLTSVAQSIDAILSTELNIGIEFIHENLLLKKINSFILQKEDVERKSFVLHFYCGYSLEQVSQLLEISAYKLNDCLSNLLNEIKNNFLNEYINK